MTCQDTQQKYNSRAAQLYREKLQHGASQAMRLHGTKVMAVLLALSPGTRYTGIHSGGSIGCQLDSFHLIDQNFNPFDCEPEAATRNGIDFTEVHLKKNIE